MPTSKPTKPESPESSSTQIEGILQSIEGYLAAVTAGVSEASPEGETRLLADATGETLRSQLAKVHVFIRESFGRLSPTQTLELKSFFDTQDAQGLAERGTRVAKAGFKAGGMGAKFLKWLVKWFQEIKKVLRELLEIIFEALDKPFPKWLDKLLLILDQIFNALVSLLVDVFGLDLGRFSTEVSVMEQDYLNELAAFQRFRNATFIENRADA